MKVFVMINQFKIKLKNNKLFYFYFYNKFKLEKIIKLLFELKFIFLICKKYPNN